MPRLSRRLVTYVIQDIFFDTVSSYTLLTSEDVFLQRKLNIARMPTEARGDIRVSYCWCKAFEFTPLWKKNLHQILLVGKLVKIHGGIAPLHHT